MLRRKKEQDLGKVLYIIDIRIREAIGLAVCTTAIIIGLVLSLIIFFQNKKLAYINDYIVTIYPFWKWSQVKEWEFQKDKNNTNSYDLFIRFNSNKLLRKRINNLSHSEKEEVENIFKGIKNK